MKKHSLMHYIYEYEQLKLDLYYNIPSGNSALVFDGEFILCVLSFGMGFLNLEVTPFK